MRLYTEEREREVVRESLSRIAKAMATGEDSAYVHFVPRASEPPVGLTNQGRAHSAYTAHIERHGLFFRSLCEVQLFEALLETGLPVMALPVVSSNRSRHSRIEPDFVVVQQGLTVVIEVDGDRFHQETPAKAQERLQHLEDEGVRVIRVNADDAAPPPEQEAAWRES